MHVDLAVVDAILDRYPGDESSLVMVLQDVQSQFNFLPGEALARVSARLGVPAARVLSVATFYKVFALEPQGRTVIQVCKGTACHVRGAQLIEDELSRQLEIPVGGTTADRAFSLRTVNCVGACAMAPVVVAGADYHPEVEPSRIKPLLRRARTAHAREQNVESPSVGTTERLASVAALAARSQQLAARHAELRGQILVCGGPGCLAGGARELAAALRAAASERGLAVQIELGRCTHPAEQHLLGMTGCQGLCQRGPLVHLRPSDVLYGRVRPADAAEIIDGVADATVVTRLLSESPTMADHPFYRGQVKQALAHCGRLVPDSLDHYLALGGFAAFGRALGSLRPADVLDAVADSGLRGRGGAGFSTGRKWRTALAAADRAGRRPYVLCNGDEGDPGAFMDRAIMEGSPFQVLEGMMLGAYALGAEEGYLYVRAEYPLAVQRLDHAIAECRRVGLLGANVLGTSLSFDVRISRGGGAFVCGESTALMRSIEGKVGEPRAKYTRSVERGLYDAPTVLNNVETWALVPRIVEHGPAEFAALGTAGSKGTKAFSLTGNVRRTGLVEVPMGTTLRELIFGNGGGVPEGRAFKAVQTGGPSGGCMPEADLDLPVDFDALDKAGSMMGSGGMIVMDETTCMVDLARYFTGFLQEESCGKCGPCRLGLPQLASLLDDFIAGRGSRAKLELIEQVAVTMADCALCGLGKSAPNPVLSTVRRFRDEYLEHIDGRCRAGVCRPLIRYEITDACTGCMACLKPCPAHAIAGTLEQRHRVDESACTRCGVCLSVCKEGAVLVTSDKRVGTSQVIGGEA